MGKSTGKDMVSLEVVQQVLRGLTVSLAAGGRMDMPQVASLLQAWAGSQSTMDPLARTMLLDLSAGLDTLGMKSRQ